MRLATFLILWCLPLLVWGEDDLLDRLREAQDTKLRAAEGWFPKDIRENISIDQFTFPEAEDAYTLLPNFPKENPNLETLLQAIREAEQEILVNTHMLTNEDIIVALIHAKYINHVNVIIILEPLPPVRNYNVPQILITNNLYTFYCQADGYNYNNYIILDRKTAYMGIPFLQSYDQHATVGLRLEGKLVQQLFLQFVHHLNRTINPEMQKVHRGHEDIEAAVLHLLFQ